MSNGARHAFGVVAGLFLPPLVAAGLWFGVAELGLTFAREFRVSWLALGVLVASAIVLAFLVGSRLSPVASLIGGLAFTAVGVVPFVEQATGIRAIPDGLLPGVLNQGYLTLAYSGLHLMLGVALLIASFFPSRWRGRVRAEQVGYEAPVWESAQSPYLPPPPYNGPEDTTRPMYRE